MTRNKRMKNSGNKVITNEREQEEAGKDRISLLPDPLLLHILSFLDDTEETVRTCILSKRWEFVWTDMLEINLRLGCYGDEDLSRFMKYRDDKELRRSVKGFGRVMAMCRNLNKFSITLRYIDRLASTVNHWLYFAIRNKVNDITLKFSIKGGGEYDLPQMLFSYSSLSKLNVSNCVMAPLGIIEWKCLESLTMCRVELLDSVMEKILSNCPVLKILDLKYCWGLDNLNIDSPNLTTLHFSGPYYPHEEGNVPDISAPYLLVLKISTNAWGRLFKLINASSVVQATIDLNSYGRDSVASNTRIINQMKAFLESLPSVEILELGPKCLTTVSVLDVKSWKFPSYTKLWSLTLEVFNHEMSIPGVLAILRSSPNLRTLRIEMTQPSLNGIENLDKYEIHVKDCKLDLVASHLKTVEIDKFRDAEDTEIDEFTDAEHTEIDEFTDAEHMLTLVQILFKSAKVLEKMVIRLKDPSSSTSIDSMKIAARLLTFPRASPESVVVLHY